MPEPQAHQALMEEIVRLEELAREWTGLFPQAAVQGQHWQKVLSQVQAHVAEDTCRLAVVGAVKSGKSTMINALVGQDLLRRGAGILTAMVTRVQPGPESRAVLRFKGWDEINGEIRRALGLLPNPRLVDRAAPLDLKAAPDRELLAQVLAEAREADLWTGGSLDQNYLLLKSYLEGYDLLQDLMPATGVLPLAGPDLARHRDLVTREATAVYLKDVLLTIPFPWPATGVELGDCQGSDSPFPQHLAQVLAYLIKSDLVLYVVSSRVGLRQADFQFLAELKRMGLMPHILPILNLDLGEHTSYAEVVKIRDRVAQELSSWQPDPRVYAFSALKLLLDRRQARGESLDPREAAVLKVWATDPDSAAFSEAEAARFEEDLKAALGDLRTRRLAGGSLAQVKMVARGLREQLELTQDLLTRGLTAIQELETRLAARRQPLHATMATVSQTLEGAGHRLKKTLRSRVDSLLDRHSGRVGQDLTEFIGNFTPDWDQLAPPSVTPAFRPVLYQLFQDIRQGVGPPRHRRGQHHPGGIYPGAGRVAAPGAGPPVAAPVSDPPGSPGPLLPGNCRSGPGGRGAHPGSRGRGPAPGPGTPPPEPGGGPRLAVCPGGVGGLGPGGLRKGLGRHQAPPEAGRGSGPPQTTSPGPGAGPGRAQGLA